MPASREGGSNSNRVDELGQADSNHSGGEHVVNGKCIAGWVTLALCGVARAEDLSTIFQEALVNNAQYRSAEAQYAAVQERVPESVSALLPAVSVSANTTWNDN